MMESGGVTEVKEEQESSDSLGFGASVDGALEGGSEEIDERRGAVPGMSATPRKAATTKRKRTPNVSKPRASNTNAKAGSRSNSQQSRGRKRWTEDKRVYSGSEDESDGDDAADADFLDESERQPRRKATIAPKHKEPSTLFDDEEEEDELMLGSGVRVFLQQTYKFDTHLYDFLAGKSKESSKSDIEETREPIPSRGEQEAKEAIIECSCFFF